MFHERDIQSSARSTCDAQLSIEAQWKQAAGTTPTEAIPVNTPTNTLATIIGISLRPSCEHGGDQRQSVTIESTVQDMGPTGQTPGAIVLASPIMATTLWI